MTRPTKAVAEAIAVAVLLVGILTWMLIDDGLYETLVTIVAIAIILGVLQVIIWAARKVGR